MRRSKGFTLIELLVSVAIFSAIAVVLYSCFRAGIVSYNRIEKEADFQQKIRYVFLIMTKDFRNMLCLSSIPFEGDEHSISFISTITQDDKADVNVGRISYYLEEESGEGALVRRVESLYEALTRLLRLEEEAEEGLSKDTAKKEPVVLKGVAELKFSYLVSNVDNLSESGEEELAGEEYEWRDFWEADYGMPLGVRVELLVPAEESRLGPVFYRQVYIPVNAGNKFQLTKVAEVN